MQQDKNNEGNEKAGRKIKMAISCSAAGLFILRAAMPNLVPSDTLSLSLLVVILLPWLSSFIDMAEFPSGWKVQFRELEKKQWKQKEEIDSLRFLIRNFLTNDEIVHLTKLSTGDDFPYEKNNRFIAELRRLRDLGLITKSSAVNIGDLPQKGYLKEYIKITDSGRMYLRLRPETDDAAHSASCKSLMESLGSSASLSALPPPPPKTYRIVSQIHTSMFRQYILVCSGKTIQHVSSIHACMYFAAHLLALPRPV